MGRARRLWRAAGAGMSLTAVILAAAGCGGSGAAKSSTTRARQGQQPAAHPAPNEAPAIPNSPAPAASVRVIKAWADALRRGDVRAAASYFRLPSELINGVGVNGLQQLIRIRTPIQAELANETLPCGAKFISASKRGPFVNALFRLTGRAGPGGGGCGSGAGQTARTDFVIKDGKIVEWLRAPDEPGDNPNGGPPPSNGPVPVV